MSSSNRGAAIFVFYRTIDVFTGEVCKHIPAFAVARPRWHAITNMIMSAEEATVPSAFEWLSQRAYFLVCRLVLEHFLFARQLKTEPYTRIPFGLLIPLTYSAKMLTEV